MATKFVFACLLFFLGKQQVDTARIIAAEIGQSVVLPCTSIDNHHRFMFWQLNNDVRVIGPGNTYDDQKYEYKVLSGELYIHYLTLYDAGLYKCVAQGVENRAQIKIRVVELVVRTQWQNYIRVYVFDNKFIVGVICVLVLFFGRGFILSMCIFPQQFFGGREVTPESWLSTIDENNQASSSVDVLPSETDGNAPTNEESNNVGNKKHD